MDNLIRGSRRTFAVAVIVFIGVGLVFYAASRYPDLQDRQSRSLQLLFRLGTRFLLIFPICIAPIFLSRAPSIQFCREGLVLVLIPARPFASSNRLIQLLAAIPIVNLLVMVGQMIAHLVKTGRRKAYTVRMPWDGIVAVLVHGTKDQQKLVIEGASFFPETNIPKTQRHTLALIAFSKPYAEIANQINALKDSPEQQLTLPSWSDAVSQ